MKQKNVLPSTEQMVHGFAFQKKDPRIHFRLFFSLAQTKHTSFWNTGTVFPCIESFLPDSNLSLFILSKKLFIFLTLTFFFSCQKWSLSNSLRQFSCWSPMWGFLQHSSEISKSTQFQFLSMKKLLSYNSLVYEQFRFPIFIQVSITPLPNALVGASTSSRWI